MYTIYRGKLYILQIYLGLLGIQRAVKVYCVYKHTLKNHDTFFLYLPKIGVWALNAFYISTADMVPM